MLSAILRRTLVWSLPLAAAYLYLLSVYGRGRVETVFLWLRVSSPARSIEFGRSGALT